MLEEKEKEKWVHAIAKHDDDDDHDDDGDGDDRDVQAGCVSLVKLGKKHRQWSGWLNVIQ